MESCLLTHDASAGGGRPHGRPSSPWGLLAPEWAAAVHARSRRGCGSGLEHGGGRDLCSCRSSAAAGCTAIRSLHLAGTPPAVPGWPRLRHWAGTLDRRPTPYARRQGVQASKPRWCSGLVAVLPQPGPSCLHAGEGAASAAAKSPALAST